jgi:hypothetical protein
MDVTKSGPVPALDAIPRKLLVVTWDEDDGSIVNQILTILSGADLTSGTDGHPIDHYGVPRMIEDSYRIAHVGRQRDCPATSRQKAAMSSQSSRGYLLCRDDRPTIAVRRTA